ncbi:GNAT family N-acetyltransferase [Minwuia sp.]|uniref:GNAT family N-acetyltransferase n=1 Tax=Minwuia sp. TaxID=2493630 RepID=UPI003A918403
MTIIRPATPDDLDAMVRLLGHLFAQEAEFAPDPEAQRRGLDLILNDADAGRLLVAERDGRHIGMVGLLYTVSTALGGRVALLEDMVVDPIARGGGTGRALLDGAIAQARADGALRITLLTDGDNAGAQRFYARAGFTRSDMVAMRLMLQLA